MTTPDLALPARFFERTFGKCTLAWYVFRQVSRPTLVALAVMLCLIWLMQSMRLLDLVINKGLGSGTFFHISLLLIPSLLLIILPLAVFVGTIAGCRRLQADSELTVMLATGRSRLKIALPALMLAAIALTIGYLNSLWVLPYAMTDFRTMKNDLRTMNGNLLLEPGTFNQMGDLMLYVDKRTGQTSFSGLLVHDTRNPLRPTTWLAKNGYVETGADGVPHIVLREGVQQERNQMPAKHSGANANNTTHNDRVEMLSFEQQTIQLDDAWKGEELTPRTRKADEFTLTELWQKAQAAELDKERNKLLTEANKRLLWPFSAIPLMLLGAGLMLQRPRRYQSTFKQMAVPIVLAVVYFALLMAGTSWGERYGTPALLLIWLLPTLTMGAGLALLTDRKK